MTPGQNALYPVLFQALRAALGLTEEEGNRYLFRAWAEVPAVEPGRDVNVCYFHLRTDPIPMPPQEEHVLDSIAQITSFIPAQLILIFYGPDCEAWAHRCHACLFLDGEGMPRKILRAAGIYPIPNPQPPAIVFEEQGATFRKRADLTISLRLRDELPYGSALIAEPIQINTVTDPPQVRIHPSP